MTRTTDSAVPQAATTWAASVPVQDLAKAIASAVGTNPVPYALCSDASRVAGQENVMLDVGCSNVHNPCNAVADSAAFGCRHAEGDGSPEVPSRTSWISCADMALPVRRPTAVEVLATAEAAANGCSTLPAARAAAGTRSAAAAADDFNSCTPWQAGGQEVDTTCCHSNMAGEAVTHDWAGHSQQQQQQELADQDSAGGLVPLKFDTLTKEGEACQEAFCLEVVAYSPTSSTGWSSAPGSIAGEDSSDEACQQEGHKKKRVSWGPTVVLYDPATDPRLYRSFWQRAWLQGQQTAEASARVCTTLSSRTGTAAAAFVVGAGVSLFAYKALRPTRQ